MNSSWEMGERLPYLLLCAVVSPSTGYYGGVGRGAPNLRLLHRLQKLPAREPSFKIPILACAAACCLTYYCHTAEGTVDSG